MHSSTIFSIVRRRVPDLSDPSVVSGASGFTSYNQRNDSDHLFGVFMRLLKHIAVLIIFTNSATASADWVHIAASAKFDGFADLDNVEVLGKLRRVSVLQNYTELQAEGFQSISARCEYDCEHKRGRVMTEEWWSQYSAKGKNITPPDTPADPRWVPVVPGSFGDLLLKILCADPE